MLAQRRLPILLASVLLDASTSGGSCFFLGPGTHLIICATLDVKGISNSTTLAAWLSQAPVYRSVIDFGSHKIDERLGSAKLPLGRVTDFAPPEDGPQRYMGHNEYIVYDETRHRIKYVVQCRAA